MVAVIAGNGLGLGNTSLTPLGGGLGGPASIGQAGVGQYLNAATGNLVLQSADEGLIFDGLSLTALRTYNSQGQLSGNQGWLFGFSRSVGGLSGTLDTAGSTITRTDDDGSAVSYAYSAASGTYVSVGQSGAQDTLSWNAGTSSWTWTEGASRRQETYSAGGQLTTLTDATTGASYRFTSSASQLTITAGDGDVLQLTGNAAQQLTGLTIQEVPPGQSAAVTRQQVGYAYDGQGRLQSVTTTLASDSNGASAASYTTRYGYDGGSDRVASVSQSDGTLVSYTYAADGHGLYRVASVTTGSGAAAQTLTLAYNLATDTTTLSNALNQTWSYAYNAAGQLVSVVAPGVNGVSATTTYQYDASGNVLQMTDPDGGVTRYGYDGSGNVLSVEDPTGHTVSNTYSADDQLLSRTIYTVPAQGVPGQAGYVAPGGAQTTYYVYDASDRLSYVVDALGGVTEHDYGTAAGGVAVLSSTQQYTGATYALSGLSPGTPPSLGALQGWAAHLAATGQLGGNARIDYSYDARGQRSAQTQWDALGAGGVGTLAGDSGAIVTRYTYDAQGRLLQTATARGADRTALATTSYAYDGLGRLLSQTDPLGNVTSYVYTDASNTLAITQANGQVTTQVRNSAGQVVSRTLSASGLASRTTTYLYNGVGEAVATLDPAGNASYTFYDADGRVSGTVDALGNVTAFTDDAAGRTVGTTAYATAVSTGGWLSGGTPTASFPASLPIPSGNACDRGSEVVFDAAGRVLATIDAQGDVVTSRADGTGQALASTAYATALTTAQRAALGRAPTWAALQAALTASATDRTTRTVDDAAGRPVATIDAAGYVVTTAYDAAGRAVQTDAYATALTAAQLAALGSAPTPAALQAVLSGGGSDRVTRTYYDGAGRAVAQVDADGYLSTIATDETTHTTTATRYATALSASQFNALTGGESHAALVGLLGSGASTQQSQTVYDADGRPLSDTGVDGTVTSYTYNAVGQWLSTTVTPGAGQGAARTTRQAYDAFGDVTGTLDAVGSAYLTAGMSAAQQAGVFAQDGSTYVYNALGQQVQRTDALGNSAWYAYDADGQLLYAVRGQPGGATRNALGNVTAYTYTAFGQVASTTTYAGQLSLTTTGASSGTTLNPATATAAQVAAAVAALATSPADPNATQATVYTTDGQVAGLTDADGYQTADTYDAFGDRVQTQQQLSGPGSALSAGNSTLSAWTYDARGEQTGATDAVGQPGTRHTATTYDAFGRVTGTLDGNGNSRVITYGYNGFGRQVNTRQTVEGVVRTTQTIDDAFGRVVTQTDALGNVTSDQYDLANHRTLVTTADGVSLTTVTDAYGDTVRVTDGAGDTTTLAYDADGRLQSSTDALGNTRTEQDDADGELTQTTDATGQVVTTRYDAAGRTLQRAVDPGGLNLVTTYAYDGEGRTLSVTDPTGTVTTYAYDADGNVLTQVQDAGAGRLNLTTTSTYDGAGQTLTVTVGAGTSAARTTQSVYDNLERLSQRIVDPGAGHLNLTTSYAYDANDNLVGVTDANGHLTRQVYDEANALTFTVAADGGVTQHWYDADGRLTQTRGYATALGAAQLAGLGGAPSAAQLAGLVSAAGNDAFQQTAYNAEGQAVYRVDGLSGSVTQSSYDAAGRVVATTRYAQPLSARATTTAPTVAAIAALVTASAGDETTLTTYDADGRARFSVQTTTVNGQRVGVVAEQRYDAAGRVVATLQYGATVPLVSGQPLIGQVSTASLAQALAGAPSHLAQSVYDSAGRLRYAIDASNNVTETQYDSAGRVLATLAYANAITPPSSLTVASVGAAVSAAGTAGARLRSTTYDAAGRVLSTGDALGTNATFAYDATGLQTRRTDRDGNVTVDAYDLAGRQTLEQTPPVTVGGWTGANGAFQQGTAYLYTTYTYDGLGNVTSISHGSGPDAAHVTVLASTAYGYDAAGRQTATTYQGSPASPTHISTQVTYDALGRAVVDQDADGNHQYTLYNSLGQITATVDGNGNISATGYDAFGNVTAVTRYAAALATGAITGWSAGQPITAAVLQQGLVTTAADRTLTTAYDPRNQKVQVQQSAIAYELGMGPAVGTSLVGQPTTTYTYDAYGNLTSSAVLLQGANATGDANATPAIWATTFTYYDALNRAVMTVTPAGNYTSPQGFVTSTSYTAWGEVQSSTQYAVAIPTAGLTPASAPPPATATTLATGGDRVTTTTYDAIGRQASTTYRRVVNFTTWVGYSYVNSVTTTTYDGENRVTGVTVNGQTTATSYDALGRVTGVTAPPRQALVSNWQALLQANPGWDLTTAALYAPVTPYTYYVYDGLGNRLLTTVTTTAGNPAAQQTWAWYDARGNAIQTQDADGNLTSTTYDNNGNLTGQTSTLTTNGAPRTVTTTYQYDKANQQLATWTQRSGQSGYDSYTQVQYNAFGEVIAKGDNLGYEAQYTYDNDGQLKSSPDAHTGAIHGFASNLAGQRVVDQTGLTGGGVSWTLNTLNLAGRVVAQVTPTAAGAAGEGPVRTFGYDRWGNVTSQTDAAGNLTTAIYDGQNHLIQQNEASVLVVSASGARSTTAPYRQWFYDVNGQLRVTVDENGNVAVNSYDAGGRLTVAQDAAGAQTLTAYDALGRAVAQQAPPTSTAGGALAHITTTSYDSLNQVTAQGDFQLNAAGTARTQQAQQTYVLNSHGDRIQVTDALGNTAYYVYDSQHRIILSRTPIQQANGWAETFTYDVNGNKTSDTDANGNTQSWVDDYFGRVQSHVDLSGALTSYTYDAHSGLLTRAASQWTPAGQTNPGYLAASWNGPGAEDDYTYDADGQVQQHTQYVNGGAVAWDVYRYDANGNTLVDNSWGSDGSGQARHQETLSQYDSHNRLSVVISEDTTSGALASRELITYDAAGNRRAVVVQSAYGPNAAPIGGGAPTGGVGAQTATPGQAWVFNAAAGFTDNAGFGLTYTASGLPGWMSFNGNGTFSGSPIAAGSWPITLTATDVNGQSVSSTFTVTVPTVAPVFTAPASNPTVSGGAPFSFSVPGATDANGLPIQYSPAWVTSAGWVALPPWLNYNGSTRTFSGTPPAGSVGTYTIVYGAAAGGLNPTQTFTLTVAPTAPVYSSGVGNQTVLNGRAFSFSYPAGAFSESDGDALTFTAGTYALSGGTETDGALPAWMSFNAGTLSFTGTPPASAIGQTFTLYLTASNPQGQIAEAHFTVSVGQYVQPAPVYNGPLANQSGVIGGAALTVALPAGAFSEPDGGALTYTGMVLIPPRTILVDQGSGPRPALVPGYWTAISKVGLSVNATTGQLTGVPTALTYPVAPGTAQIISGPGGSPGVPVGGTASTESDLTYQLQIIATNAQGGAAAGTLTLANTYGPPALTGAIPAQTITPNGTTQTYTLPSVFSDPYGHGLTYTSNAPAWAVLGGTGTFTFNAGTEPPGSYSWTVTATDGLGQSNSTTIAVTVVAVAPVFTGPVSNQVGVYGRAFSFSVPGATDANGLAIGYNPAWVNGGNYVPLPSWLNYNPTTRTFSGTPPAGSAGTYTIVYGAAAGGFNPTQTFTLAVYGPPTVTAALPAQTITPNGTAQTYALPPVFTDPYGHGLTYSSNAPAWAALSNTGTFTFNASTEPSGSYNWTVTATDGLGQSVSTTIAVTVVNVAPVFNSTVGNVSVTQGTPFSFQVPGAHDNNGDALGSYVPYYYNGTAYVALPSWVSFNASTLTFSGTAPQPGNFGLSVWVADPNGGLAAEGFVLSVAARPPQYVGTLNGKNVAFPAPNGTITVANQFSDPQGEALTYTARQGSGMALPTWLTFDPVHQVFTRNLSLATGPGTGSGGGLSVQLTATDTSGLSASLTFTIGGVAQGGAVSAQAAPALVSRQAVAAPAVTTQAVTAQAAAATTPNVQTSWFTYDADNRVLVSNGALVNGQVVITAGTYTAPSVGNQYDAAGNVVLRSTINSAAYTVPSGTQTKSYGAGDLMSQRLIYDARNELVESDYAVDVSEHEASLGAQNRYTYDADGHQLLDATYFRGDFFISATDTPDFPHGTEYMSASGWLNQAQITSYNADGTVAQVSGYGRVQGWEQALILAVNYHDKVLPDEVDIALDGTGVLGLNTVTAYTGYDHVGNVTTYSYTQPNVFGATYTVNYLKKDGYLEQSTTGTPAPGVTGYVLATDTSYYDAFGRRIAVSQTSQGNSGAAQNTTRVFGDDTSGEIVQKRSGTLSGSTFTPFGGGATDHYTYAEGQALSVLDEAGNISALTALTGFSDSPGTQGYVVQAGDTLASIAQGVYGNSSYGYLIGEANDLGASDALVQGQSLTLPSITTSSNSATTFKPYNASAIVGSTTPTLPTAPPPPPSSHGCNVLASIVEIAVTAVVASFIGPWAAQFGPALGGAITGAAVDASGQLAGDALGVHQGFSLGELAESSAEAAIGGDLDNQLSTGNLAGTFGSASGNGIDAAGNALIGAASYLGGYAVGQLTGQATHFSWAGLVADAAGSAAGGEFGPTNAQSAAGLQGGFSASQVAARAVQDLVTRETSRALGDDHTQSWQQIGEDVFGNALGNAAVHAYDQPNPASQMPAYDPSSDALLNYAQGYQNESAFEQSATAFMSDAPMLADASTVSVNPAAGAMSGGSGVMSTDTSVGDSGNAADDQLARLRALIPAMQAYRTDPSVDHSALLAATQDVEQATQDAFHQTDNAEASVERAENDVATLAPQTNDSSTDAGVASSFSLATAGMGVGSVDTFGQPLTAGQPSNFSLLGSYGNVWDSDESLGTKALQSFQLLNYTTPDADQRIAADEAAQRAAEAPFATLNMLTESPFAGASYGISKLVGASDETALKVAQTTAVGVAVFATGFSAYGISRLNNGNVLNNAALTGEFTPIRFGGNGQVYAKLPAPSNPNVMRWQRMTTEGMSNRDLYMGGTPSRDSAVGLQVQSRMISNGALIGEDADRQVLGPDGGWYPIGQTDMGHIESAVDFWNNEGRYYGPRSTQVRAFMNNADNYILEPSSINRSNGALMGRTYLPPATQAEQAQFFNIDDL